MTTDMDTKVDFLAGLAGLVLRQRGRRMTVPDVARIMDHQGMLTSSGARFVGGRGTYALLEKAYKRLEDAGRHADAKNVAEAFVQPNGSYAWDK